MSLGYSWPQQALLRSHHFGQPGFEARFDLTPWNYLQTERDNVFSLLVKEGLEYTPDCAPPQSHLWPPSGMRPALHELYDPDLFCILKRPKEPLLTGTICSFKKFALLRDKIGIAALHK